MNLLKSLFTSILKLPFIGFILTKKLIKLALLIIIVFVIGVATLNHFEFFETKIDFATLVPDLTPKDPDFMPTIESGLSSANDKLNKIIKAGISYTEKDKEKTPKIELKETTEGISINWQTIEGADSYIVYRGKTLNELKVLQKEITDISFIDKTSNDLTFYYSVAAVFGKEEIQSDILVRYTKPSPVKPLSESDGKKIRLSWIKAQGADKYSILRSTKPTGPFYAIKDNIMSTNYIDSNVKSGTKYYYQINAICTVTGKTTISQSVEASTEKKVDEFNPKGDDDGDGLTNERELIFGTDYRNEDTDFDGIKDGDELSKYKTNPRNPDTDGDGLYDGAEINQKTDPNKKNNTKYISRQAVSTSGNVVVRLEGNQNISIAPLSITDSDNAFIKSLKNTAVKPFTISNGGFKFSTSTIAVAYDEKELKNINENNLVIMNLNIKTKKFEEIKNVKVDVQKNIITGNTENLGTFIVTEKGKSNDLNNMDIVFTIDQSGSMQTSDPDYYRIKVIEKFVNDMESSENSIGLMQFNHITTKLTDTIQDKAKLLSILKTMYTREGDTNLYDALLDSGKMLEHNDSNKKKQIIFLSDGNDTCKHTDEQVINAARTLAAKEIVVNTVALGKDTNRKLLESIASVTGGTYYYITNEGGLTQQDVNFQLEKLYSNMTKQLNLTKVEDDLTPKRAAEMYSNLVETKTTIDEETKTTIEETSFNYEVKDLLGKDSKDGLTLESFYNSDGEKTKTGYGWRTNYDSRIKQITCLKIKEDNVTVRKNPSLVDPSTKDDNTISLLNKGATLEIAIDDEKEIKAINGWWKVKLSNEKFGYINDKYVTKVESVEVNYPTGESIKFDKGSDGKYTSLSTKDIVEKNAESFVLSVEKDKSTRTYTEEKMTSIKYSTGFEVKINYNGEKIDNVTDSSNNMLDFHYGFFSGLLNSIDTPKGKVEFDYDGKTLSEIKDVTGTTTKFAYKETKLTQIQNTEGKTLIENEYDPFGRLVKQTSDSKTSYKVYSSWVESSIEEDIKG